MAISTWRIPAIVATGIICFVAGVGLGGLGGASLGDHFKQKFNEEGALTPEQAEEAMAQSRANMGKGGMGKGGMGKGGMGKGGMGKGGAGMNPMGGMRGPNPKTQLATLVNKLDQLAKKPLSISLTDEKRAKLREQLQGLDTKEELSPEEAMKRIEAIQEIVKDDKATLEAAGYSWRGEGGGGGGGGGQGNAPNPFTSEANGKHLKSLQEQVKGKGA